jgi:hypothetical protein
MRQKYSPIHLIESNTVNFDTLVEHPKCGNVLKKIYLTHIQRTFVKKNPS